MLLSYTMLLGYGWLEFNGTFCTKRLYHALQKVKFVKEFYFS